MTTGSNWLGTVAGSPCSVRVVEEIKHSPANEIFRIMDTLSIT